MNQQPILDGSAFLFAQKLSVKPAYSIKEDAVPVAGSVMTAYRRLNSLKSLGIAKTGRGRFMINTTVISQPAYLVEKLLPSLISLKNGRRFGRYYSDSDVRFVMDNISHRLVTLDYKAWELTKFQYPADLYLYVDNIGNTIELLKNNGFSEGKKGRIVILPMIGDFSNQIERVYLDCIANGGRSVQDAVAIELLHGDKLNLRGSFPVDLIRKVQEDLPMEQ